MFKPVVPVSNLRILVRAVVLSIGVLSVLSCTRADSQADRGSAGRVPGPEIQGVDGFEVPEPGSAPMERIDTRITGGAERSSSREPRVVEDERLLVLPHGVLPEPVAPMDTEMEVELAGEFLSGTERELYRIVDRFFTVYSEGEIELEYVSPGYASSVGRRLEPATSSGRLPDTWRIGIPRFSLGGAAVPVRLYFSTGSRAENVMGTIYFDESGLVEDVQIDVRSPGVQ